MPHKFGFIFPLKPIGLFLSSVTTEAKNNRGLFLRVNVHRCESDTIVFSRKHQCACKHNFLSFFFFFFSMNTHRVYLKATRPYFTASVGFLLPWVPLQFNNVLKKEKANAKMRQNRGFVGLNPISGRKLTCKRKKNKFHFPKNYF